MDGCFGWAPATKRTAGKRVVGRRHAYIPQVEARVASSVHAGLYVFYVGVCRRGIECTCQFSCSWRAARVRLVCCRQPHVTLGQRASNAARTGVAGCSHACRSMAQ